MAQFDNFINHLIVLTNDNEIIWKYNNGCHHNFKCTYDNHTLVFNKVGCINCFTLQIDKSDYCTVNNEFGRSLYQAISEQTENSTKKSILEQIHFYKTPTESEKSKFIQIINKLHLLTINNRVIWKCICITDYKTILTTVLDNFKIDIWKCFDIKNRVTYTVRTSVDSLFYTFKVCEDSSFLNEMEQLEKLITTVINIKENKYPEDIINDYLDTLIKA